MSTRTLSSYQLAGRHGGLVSAGLRQKVRRLRRLDPALAPVVKASTQDIVFAAGFYEGDGSCCAKGHSVGVTVSQKDCEVLDWLRSRFGGNVYQSKSRLSQWQISGARARGFLQSIYGLLSSRRQRQALKALRLNPGIAPCELVRR